MISRVKGSLKPHKIISKISHDPRHYNFYNHYLSRFIIFVKNMYINYLNEVYKWILSRKPNDSKNTYLYIYFSIHFCSNVESNELQ